MPLSPFHRTTLATVLALVAAAMIATGAPPAEADASSPRAATVSPVPAASLPLVQAVEA